MIQISLSLHVVHLLSVIYLFIKKYFKFKGTPWDDINFRF